MKKTVLLAASGLAALLMCISCKPSTSGKGTDGPDDKPVDKPEVSGYGDPKTLPGWDIYKAGTYRYGPCFINNEDGSIDAWFASPGGYHGDEDQMLYNLTTPHNSPYQVRNGDAAQYFKCDREFHAVQICCPTWGSSTESMTFKLFRWDTDYATTVAGEPVYQTREVNMADNGWVSLYLNEDAKLDHETMIPAGEYLWVATEASSTAGIWANNGTAASTGGLSPKSFIKGIEKANFQFESRVLTTYTTGALYWDKITYQHSEDGGKTWTEEVTALKPTEFSMDALSCCDPGVARWGGWYYIGYTSTEDGRGTDNNVFVARSKNPAGPWEKWNGEGWGGMPKPVIQYHGVGNKDNFGAGEPCFVVLDGTVYFYYSWNNADPETRVSTASADDEFWPAHLEYKGVAIDKKNPGIQSADHSDVKYRPDLKQFHAINTAKRMTENAYIQLWVSEDGLKYTLAGTLRGSGMQKGLHNCGWSGDAMGIQDPSKPQYIGYAYGIGSWGQWNTWFAPLSFSK